MHFKRKLLELNRIKLPIRTLVPATRSVGHGGTVLHDDHVDGLNHELGLLGARLHGLSSLGETGSLGNGSSLGSEGSDLSTSRLHLLLVSGVASEFGMVSSHADGLRGSLVLSDDSSASVVVRGTTDGTAMDVLHSLSSGGWLSMVVRGTTDGLHFLSSAGLHFLDVSGSLSFLSCSKGSLFHAVSGFLGCSKGSLFHAVSGSFGFLGCSKGSHFHDMNGSFGFLGCSKGFFG